MKILTLIMLSTVLTLSSYGMDEENKATWNKKNGFQEMSQNNSTEGTGWYDLPAELHWKIFNHVLKTKKPHTDVLKDLILVDKYYQEFLEKMVGNIRFVLSRPLSTDTSHKKKLSSKHIRMMLERYTHLSDLRLPGHLSISPKTSKTLLKLESLTSLDLSHRKSSTIFSPWFGKIPFEKLTQLTSLNLSYCNLNDNKLIHLLSLTCLSSLNLSHNKSIDCRIDDKDTIHFYKKRLSDKGLIYLSPLTRLTSLNLVGVNLTKASLSLLMRCKTITISRSSFYIIGPSKLTMSCQKIGIHLIVK